MQRFQLGDAVRTRVTNPGGHTRLPAYLRGKPGLIDGVHGLYPLPDERARGGDGSVPQALYTVVFRAADVWGDDAAEPFAISADLWDAYLVPRVARNG